MNRNYDLYKKVSSKWEELKSISPDIRYFLSTLDQKPGIKVGVFGGAVRDWYLGKEPKDIDIVIEAPDQMLIDLLSNFGAQKNGFDGNVLQMDGVVFDFWALKDTFAFRSGQFSVSWSNLAVSVPFNTDSVVVRLDGTVLLYNFWDAMDRRKIEFLNQTTRDSKRIAARAVLQAQKYNFELSNELKAFCKKHLGGEFVITSSSNSSNNSSSKLITKSISESSDFSDLLGAEEDFILPMPEQNLASTKLIDYSSSN